MDNAFKKYSIDTTDYQVGQDNVQKWGFDIHNPVFGISAGLVVFCLISLLLVEPTTARDVLNGLKNGIIEQFDAFFYVVDKLLLIVRRCSSFFSAR